MRQVRPSCPRSWSRLACTQASIPNILGTGTTRHSVDHTGLAKQYGPKRQRCAEREGRNVLQRLEATARTEVDHDPAGQIEEVHFGAFGGARASEG